MSEATPGNMKAMTTRSAVPPMTMPRTNRHAPGGSGGAAGSHHVPPPVAGRSPASEPVLAIGWRELSQDPGGAQALRYHFADVPSGGFATARGGRPGRARR